MRIRQILPIDEMANREKLKRVDLIKMDIEGAELQALIGAEKTIKKYKPVLVISLYHKLEHIWQIPEFINNLDLNYRFYIDHFTISLTETMLFAVCDESKIPPSRN